MSSLNKKTTNSAQAGHPRPVAVVVKKEKDAALSWRQYAGHLRANLEARKMAEDALLDELRKANVNHPMATVEGFSTTFKKMLSEQYSADQLAFDQREAERMRKADEEGGVAVS